MRPHLSLNLSRRNLNVFIACLLSFSLLMMPFVPIAAAASRGSKRQSPVSRDKSSPTSSAVNVSAANAPLPVPAPEPLAVAITATKTDALIGDDGDGKADPAGTEKIEYTVTISNGGSTDATGVTFNDTIDAHTTLVGGSVNTQPIADPDTYSASGNIAISLAAPGVLGNDRDPDTGDASGLTVTKVQGSAANVGVATDTTKAGNGGVKGSVTLNANGSFTYEPPPGYEGTGVNGDSFTYEISDGTTTDTATVTIDITGMVWFISNNSGGSNRGTFSNPFTSIASFNAANVSGVAPAPKNGDFISLRQGTGTYNESDGINLRAQQKLIGNAIQFNTVFSASSNSIAAYNTFAGATTAAPTITTSAGNGIDLATDNTVRGLNVGNTPGFFKVNGGAVGSPIINTINLGGTGGALNVSTSGAFGANVAFGTFESTSSPGANLNLVNVTGSLTVGSAGAGLSGSAAASSAVNVSGGTVIFSYPGAVAKTSGTGALVSVSGGHSAGTITFTGALSAAAGTGLQFDNADGTYNFNGTTTLNGGDAGIDIVSGSSGTFSFASGTTITSPTGIAFNVATSPGNPSVTYAGTITQNSANRVVNIDGTTGNTISFTDSATGLVGGSSSTGININNANGNVSFAKLTLGTSGARMTNPAVTINGGTGTYGLGTISIFTNGARGVFAQNADGTLNITTGEVDTTAAAAGATAAAFHIDGPAGLTTLGISLTKVNVNNSTFGILLQDTNGSFTVAGAASGSDRCGGSVTVNALGTPATFNATVPAECTGGLIQNITTSGVQLTNATNVSLTRMSFVSANTADGGAAGGTCDLGNVSTCNGAIDLTNVTGVTLSRINISGAEEQGIVGSNVTGFSLSNSNVQNAGNAAAENGAYFLNLFGVVSVTGTRITGSAFNNLGILNDGTVSGTLNMTVSGSMFTSNSSIGGDGIVIDTRANTTSNISVGTSTFTANKDDHFNAVSSSNAVTNVTFNNNTLTGGHASPTGQGIALRVGGPFSGTYRFDVNTNSINGAIPTAINTGMGSSTSAAVMHGTIRNNTVGTAGVALSGSAQGSCILVENNGVGQSGHATPAGTFHALVTNNTLKRCFDKGIDLLAVRDGNNNLNVTVSNNNVNELVNVNSRWAVRLETGSSLGDETGTVCADIINNTLFAQTIVDEMSVRARSNATLRFPGYTGGLTNTTDLVNYLQGRNPAGGTAVVNPPSGASTFNNTNPAGSACTQPTLPTTPLVSDAAPGFKRFNNGNIAPAVQRETVRASAEVAQHTSTERSLISRAFQAVAQFASGVMSLVEPTAHAAEAQPTTAPVAYSQVSNGGLQKDRINVGNNRKTVSNHARSSRALAPSTPMVSGETVNINIGTLRAGDSVTITFQVTVNNPPNLTLLSPPHVTNQGTVSGTNFSDVPTDDPTGGGAADPTDTPVDLFDSQTTLISDLNPANQGDNITFTATVAIDPSQTPTPPSPVTPTGTVTFKSDGVNITGCENVALDGSGQAQCSTNTLTPPSHNITAEYSGDGNYDPSTSNTVSQTIIACATNPIVTSTADSGAGTLRDALANVCNNNTITFDITGDGPHTITLTTGELEVAKDVTVRNSSGEKITVSGNNASRVFNINASKTAAIIGLTISGGSATSGGGILNSGTLTVINSTFTGNTTTTGDGGAIDNPGTLTVINSTFSGNSAATNGGGIFSSNVLTSLSNTFTNNRADSDNNGTGTGGGIHRSAGTATLHNTIVAGNFNEDGGTDSNDDIGGNLDGASSHNLVGDAATAGALTNGTNGNIVGNAGTGTINVATVIDTTLADNGGTTQTHQLIPSGPAVEAGSNAALPADTFDLDGDMDTSETLPVDQRGAGFPRAADSQDADAVQTVDIGAFELHPSIEDITNKTVAEDTLLSFSFNLGDGTGSLIQSVTATSSNTTLVPNANISVTGSGSTRTLDITPAADANTPSDGTTTITVTVTATNGRTAVDSFDVTVTEVNDNPVAGDDMLSAIDEDSGTRVISFATLLGNDSAGPANESGQTLNITNVGNPVGGTVAINGTNVEFTPAADFFGAASFDYTVTDNGTTNGVLDAKSDTGSVSFTINPINDPPSFTIAADPPASNEDGGPQTVLNFATNISAGPNEMGQVLTFNLSPTGSTGTLTFSSGPAIDATTGTLTYTATADTNGTASFSVTLSDDGSNTPPNSNTSAAQSFTITVNAQNDAPVVTTTAGNMAYTENDPATAIDPGLTVTDGDSPDLTGATVAITSGFDAAQDTLGFMDQLGITGNYDSGTGVLTLSGTASVADYQTALRSVTYQNGSDNPTLSRTVTFTANDGAATGMATRGISITAVNDAPVNTVPGAQSTNQNTPLTFSSANGNQISVADADAGSADIRVTLTATNGTISLATTAGLMFGAGDGTDDATMTFDGTLTEVNTAMNGMFYTPNMGFSGAATLTITSNDLGNSGSGGPLSDTDVVNIQVATNVSIQDASLVEPKNNTTANMIFTVTLSAPAPAGGASVDFATQDEAPALNHATAGEDYTTTSGTVNFAAGEQFKTIEVPILGDNKKNEVNETFLVVLSNPVNATIADGTATGTIIENDQPGAILISEIRTSGPAGAGDDFVEIYNNSSSAHIVNGTGGGYGLFKMGATCGDTPVLIGVIPNGTVIPARGHYLFTGSAYSLADYGGTGAAAGDSSLSSDIENDRSVAIFSTASLGSISSANRLDAVGFGANTGGTCDLFREGTTLTPLSGSTLEYSYLRDECGKKGNPSTFGPCPTAGLVADSNVNGDDFFFVDTLVTATPAGQRLGAPGPQNLGSPRTTFDVLAFLLDSSKSAAGNPNRVRDTSAIGPNAAEGTMSIRRRFMNNTGANVTRLRFRIVDISTAPATGSTADLRVLSSGDITVSVNDAATCTAAGFPSAPCTVTVLGTTLETPPAQPLGGGFNSSVTNGTITLATPLAPGASVNLQFLLGVQTTGGFKFFFNIEALP